MGNLFDVNRAVAVNYVRAEQVKGWFLSSAKMILVILSGSMMFLGVTLAAANVNTFSWDEVAPKLPIIAPISVVAALLAVVIEGGTIFSGAYYKEQAKAAEQELSLLDKVKVRFTVDEYTKKKKKIQAKPRISLAIMVVCASFSIAGAEIFWQRIMADQTVFFHIIGAVMGVVCSSLLILFELKSEIVERIVERCISSSGLIQLALDQSAKSKIHDKLFEARAEKLDSPEFEKIISQAAEQGLYGVLEDAVRMAGANVTAAQLQMSVQEEAAVRDAAEQFLASGGQSPAPALPSGPAKKSAPGRRVNANRKKVVELVKKHGLQRLVNDPDQYANDVSMDKRTLEHWLEDIRQYGM